MTIDNECKNLDEMTDGNFTNKLKILVLGDSGVGKTTLVHLLCTGTPLHYARWTVGCSPDVMVSCVVFTLLYTSYRSVCV